MTRLYEDNKEQASQSKHHSAASLAGRWAVGARKISTDGTKGWVQGIEERKMGSCSMGIEF